MIMPNRIALLLGMTALVLAAMASPASATLCYQETATSATSCGGQATGTYKFTGSWTNNQNTYDENWGSSGKYASGCAEAYVNYTKPTGVTGAVITFKYGTDTTNYTITSDCLNAFSTNMTIYFYSCSDPRGGMDCMNNASTSPYVILAPNWASGFDIFEEGIWWTLPASAPTITIVSPVASPAYNTTMVWLNVTADQTINTWKYSLNGAANVTFTPNITVTVPTGSNTIIVYGNNTDGNTGNASVTFQVLNITVALDVVPTILYKTTDANFSVFYNETAGRAANVTINISVGGLNVTNITTYEDVAPGTTLYFYIMAGNYSKGQLVRLQVNVTANNSDTDSAILDRTVQNSVPTVPNPIIFSPTSAIIGDILNATGASTDADGDTPTYWFVWGYPNGTNISAGWTTNANLSITTPYENETLRVYVMAGDGTVNGTMNFTNFTVTHMEITLPVHGTEYIGSTLSFAFNFTAQATQNCTEALGPAGNTTAYALGLISSSQNHSRYSWYSNASVYNVTCFSSQDSSRVYYKTVNYTNAFANWSVSIYTENGWDTPLNITGANLSIFVNCEGGSQYLYNFTGVTIYDVKPLCDVQSIVAKVDYPTDSYTRERSIPDCTNCDVRMYMVDALVYTVLQIPIYMSDYQYFDSKIELYKLSGGNHYTIAEGYFDVERKYVTYLTKDNTYYLRITLGSEVRDIGYLYAATATAQYLSLSSINLRPSITLISDNIQMAAAFDNASAPTSTLRITYNDYLNLTESVRIRIFNDTSNSAWYDNTYNGTSNLTVSLNGINTSVRYSVHFTVEHQLLGNSPIEYTTGIGAFGRNVDLGIPNWAYAAIAFVCMLLTAFVIVPEIRIPGYIMLMVEFAVFVYFTWFEFQGGVIAILAVFLVAGLIYELKFRGAT